MNYKAIAIGIVIFLVGLVASITMPFYYPNYQEVNSVYASHLSYVVIPAGAEKIVSNFTTNSTYNAVIAFIQSGTGNITIFNISSGDLKQITTQSSLVSAELTPGKYAIAIVNPQGIAQNISYTYGVFNANFLNSFYSGLGILSTITEILTLGGIAITIIAVIYEIINRKRKK
ncbi:hypothetical protein [Acidianus sp. RZ1]|uniref:hypothetical protein n=1 Tax=Acidianus sp. RZ1 TaxID=1540082 RepID=UPI001492327B|nr:hypothetical protein [Acidianus sp. RZ1]NON62050.1 hypothetical protein [Acidianus sp. RZ1]